MKKTHQLPSIHLLKAPPAILLEGDLEGYVPTKMDFKIANMYDGSYIRSNDSRQNLVEKISFANYSSTSTLRATRWTNR